MRILFISSAYGKGGAATNQLWAELCEHFAKFHSVTVLTAAWHPATPAKRCENGVQICSVGAGILPKITNRHLWEAGLWLLLGWKLLRMRGTYDLTVCVDTPRFSALLGWLRKCRDRCKVVSWVMDLPLEQLVRRDAGCQRLSDRLAPPMNRLYYSTLGLCVRVVVLGSCMRNILENRGVESLEVIGPWTSISGASPELSAPEARAENQVPNKFTITYLGYAGAWHEFDTILKAIPELLASGQVQFIFAGLGPGIDRIAKEKELHAWDGVVIQGWVPREKLGVLPQCADLHLVSLKPSMLGTCVPSKTYGAFSCGRPVLFVGPKDCQAAQDILDADAGRVVENAEELVAAVEGFLANPATLELCSRNARKAVLEKHCAQAIFKKWDDLLADIVENN